MQGKLTAELTARVRADVVETTLMERLGLKDGDLYGVAAAATAALRSGDAVRAFDGFAHLVILDPTNPDFHAGLAEASLAVGYHAMALQSASVVVAVRPASPDGYFLSARACIGMGEHALALEDIAETEQRALKAGEGEMVAAARKLRALVSDAGVATA